MAATTIGRPGWNKGRKFPAEVLTPDEVRALISAPSLRAPTGVRNRALLVAMYRAGLRVSEALALETKDVDLRTGSVRVLHGKGDRARTVAISAEACDSIARWLDVRRKRGIRSRRLFTTLGGGPMSPQYVRDMMRRMAARGGIEKRVHPHGLRHTRAAEMAREGKATNLIQDALGHGSLATTDRYLRHIEPTAVLEAMRDDWSLDDEAQA